MKKLLMMSCLVLTGCQSTSSETGVGAKPSDWDTEWGSVWKKNSIFSGKSKILYFSKINSSTISNKLSDESDSAKNYFNWLELNQHKAIMAKTTLYDISQCKWVEKKIFNKKYNNLEQDKNLDVSIYVSSTRTDIYLKNIRKYSSFDKMQEVRCNFDLGKIEKIAIVAAKHELEKIVAEEFSQQEIKKKKLAKQVEKEKTRAAKKKANAHFYAMKETAQTMATVNYCEEHFLLSSKASKSYSKKSIAELKATVGTKYDKDYLNGQYVNTKAILKYADYRTLSISCGIMQDAYNAENGKVF